MQGIAYFDTITLYLTTLCLCVVVMRSNVVVSVSACATEDFACCVGMVLPRCSYQPPHTDVVLTQITDSRMADVLRGSPWEILRTFLSLDVLLRLRTTGTYGDIFHYLLLSDEGHNAFPYIRALLHCCPTLSRAVVCPRIWVIFGDMEVRQ